MIEKLKNTSKEEVEVVKVTKEN
jgi:hypothetical protein